MEYASPLRRLMAWLLDTALLLLTLFIGYIIWWLITLRQGQTPGKQLLGIRAVKRDGSPAGWGITFVREIVKGVVNSSGIGFIANIVLMMLDESEHRSISDRVADTVIIRKR